MPLAGTGLAAKGTALGDRKCTSKLAYLEELIDRYYLGDKDEEKASGRALCRSSLWAE